MNNKLEIIKKVLQYSASLGTSMVVTRGITYNVPAPTKPVPLFAFKAGTFGISGMAGAKVFNYVGEEFDEIVDIFREIDKKPKEK